MNRLLLVLPLLMASCSPLVTTVLNSDLAKGLITGGIAYAQNEKATLTQVNGKVYFSNLGVDTAKLVTIALKGPTDVPGCTEASGVWLCKIGDVKANSAAVINVTGKANAYNGSFYRDSAGNRPVYVQGK